MAKNPYRLDSTVVPRHYQLALTPSLEQASFSGTVTIEVEVTEAVTSVTLNAIELELSEMTVTTPSGSRRSAMPNYDEEYETATFTFDEPLEVGPASLSMSFTGILNDQLHGFYRSTFTDVAGVTHTIATTQFEATDARRAFPCWDEPAVKATYQVTLTIPSHLAAYSNTAAIEEIDHGNGTTTVAFATTMKMSTYLVAFVVGPFEATAPIDVAGTPVRVVFPVGKGHLTSYALEVAEHALTFFAAYFDIPYPGDKVDLVAIPDFAAGAMENLGCVTFRETELLIDPAAASFAEIERVALVINHELAHMWFGDLVTMDWWEGIWLNEAFATFMESICTDHFRPQWKKWVGFNPSRDMAFAVDGQHSTRAIEYEVISPADCRGMFDVLTYIKGCSVLRMLEQYLGEETFRDGIRQYLRTHAYANTVTQDLWNALEAASGQPVGEIMDTWILQGGYPLITVDGGVASQQPFHYAPPTGASSIGAQWKVPVLTRSLGSTEVRRHLLGAEPLSIDGAGIHLVNAGGSGFYRTAYGTAELAGIAAQLGDLDELERAVLFSDTWAATLVGRGSLEGLLRLAQGLKDLDEPSAWSVVARALRLLARIATGADAASLASFTGSILAPVVERLGWEPTVGESEQAGELRGLALELLGTIGKDPAVIAEATARFDAGAVRGDLAQPIVSITVRQNRAGDLEECERRRLAAATPQEEQRYLFAQALFPDAKVARATFERAFDDVRTQDAPYLIGTLIRNPFVGAEIWERMAERFDEAIERFPAGSPAAMVAGVETMVGDPALAAKIRAFHTDHELPAGQRQVTQVLDIMDLHVGFCQRIAPELGSILAALTS